ncbi:MAG: aminoacyl-tRNA hydrolase [Bacteroidetes bacterium]|nr:aminoacyl-tRNA hydrolase [Bacteroidota bacterium]
MNTIPIRERNLDTEFILSATRSSGPGGQNVNKVSSKIELRFNLYASAFLTEDEKNIIAQKLANRINNEGELLIVSQSERSQLQNKEMVIERFFALLEECLKPVKKRRATKPSLASKIRRLDHKKMLSKKKNDRKGFGFE